MKIILQNSTKTLWVKGESDSPVIDIVGVDGRVTHVLHTDIEALINYVNTVRDHLDV